mgnify:CR=1 FL=1|jgi:DNA-binding Xre family transcriptional regulator
MTVSYNKLWKLLIDRKMKKKELCKAAGISSSLIAKMGRDENVNIETLAKICSALNCTMDDIVELMPKENK